MDGQTRSCYTGPEGTQDKGDCKSGVQTCENGQWGVCWSEVWPQTEKCDGSDNNCDGQTDEGCECIDGHTKTCYDGEAGTQGIGICSEGTQTCSGGHWSACSGQVMPDPEICDGLDNDCNGVVDDILNDPCCKSKDPCCGKEADLCCEEKNKDAAGGN